MPITTRLLGRLDPLIDEAVLLPELELPLPHAAANSAMPINTTNAHAAFASLHTTIIIVAASTNADPG